MGGGYRLGGASSLAACEQYEGCREDGTSPFANGTLVLMHNGTDMPLVLASDPPKVPGTRKGGTDAANAATWRVTPAPLVSTTAADSTSTSSASGTSASESVAADCNAVPAECCSCIPYAYCLTSFDQNCKNAPSHCGSACTQHAHCNSSLEALCGGGRSTGTADWAVPIGSDTPVYLESFDAPGYVLSAATADGSLHLRKAGTRGHAQRWRMVSGVDGEGATVFQSAEAPGLTLSVEPLAMASGDVLAPLLHRGAFASRTSRLVLAPHRPSSAAAQLVRAAAPAEYPALALWARPSGSGLGSAGDERRDSFLMVPLNEIVDEHFSVYFCRVDDRQGGGGAARSLPAFC